MSVHRDENGVLHDQYMSTLLRDASSIDACAVKRA